MAPPQKAPLGLASRPHSPWVPREKRGNLPLHLALLADLKTARGEFAQANELYGRAADVVEGMLVDSPSELMKSALINTMGDVYLGHFQLAATGLRSPRIAYEVLEAARGRSIADALRDQRAKSPPSDPVSLAAKKEMNQIQLALLHETDQGERTKLLDRLFEAEQVLTPVSRPRTELQKAALHPRPVDLVELQRSLHPDEMLLEYVLTEPRSFCLQITSRTAAVSALPAGRKQIEELVESYRGQVRSMKAGADTAEKLYSVLLRPISGEASKLRLIIVPDGELNLLPFDALQDPKGRYVLDSQVVTYAPSATVLYTIRTSPRTHDPRMSLLGVGDVPYQQWPVRRANAPPAGSQLAAATTDPFDLSGARLGDLPKTRDEVMAATHALGGDSHLLLGRDATASVVAIFLSLCLILNDMSGGIAKSVQTPGPL